MSNKFEQLLDYLVNEEMDKANELFHEIVVEKSREIYGDLIAEEADDEEAEDDQQDESMEADEEADESVEENIMDADDESMYEIGGDPADNMVDAVSDQDAMDMDSDDMGGDDMDADEMDSDELASKDDIMDIKDDIAELKAEFEALLAAEKAEPEHEGEISDMDSDGDLDIETDDEDSDEADDEESDEDDFDEAYSEADDEEADEQFMREYREVVGKPYSGGKVAGKSEEASTNTKAVVSSAKDRPSTTASAGNIAQDSKGEDKKAGADAKSLAGSVKGEFTKGITTNLNGKQSGVKTLKKEPAGHGAEKKGSSEVSGTNTKPIVDRKQ